MIKNRFRIIGFADKGRGTAIPASPFPGSDRSALLVTVLFVFFVLSIPKFNLSEVIAFAAFPVFLISAAKLPVTMILKRLLLLSPFVLFMAAGNLLFDRTPVVRLYGLTITGGIISGSVIVAKTMITVAGMLSVTHCIPFYRICRALEAFHVPEVLVTQLMLLYRYSSVLHEEASAMQKARDIRSFGNKGNDLSHTAALIGSLLLRTTDRAERVYRAMIARGFQERISSRPSGKISSGEWITIVIWSLLFLLLRMIF